MQSILRSPAVWDKGNDAAGRAGARASGKNSCGLAPWRGTDTDRKREAALLALPPPEEDAAGGQASPAATTSSINASNRARGRAPT